MHADLSAVGFKVAIEKVNSAKFYGLVTEGKHALYIGDMGLNVPEPQEQFFGQLGCDNPRHRRWGYCDKKRDELLAQQAGERNQEKRRQMVFVLQKMLLDAVTHVPLLQPVLHRRQQEGRRIRPRSGPQHVLPEGLPDQDLGRGSRGFVRAVRFFSPHSLARLLSCPSAAGQPRRAARGPGVSAGRSRGPPRTATRCATIPIAQDTRHRLQGISAAHWLGTDDFGRDIFTRLLCGAQTVLLVAFESIGFALAVGTLLGILAGYRAATWTAW